LPDTPNLDQLESCPWTSYVTYLKRLANEYPMMSDLPGQLETIYRIKVGYWKGGTVGVVGYGAGIISRFTELKDAEGKPLFPEAAEFHTLRGRRLLSPRGWSVPTTVANWPAVPWKAARSSAPATAPASMCAAAA
jgi:hypothetical protein